MRLIEGRSFYKEPWYGSYHSMMDRCYRKKAHNYPQYGGRGIAVCEGRPMPIVAYEYKIRDVGATPEAVSAGFEQRLSAVEERLNQLTDGKRDAKKAEVKRNDA